MKRILLTGGGTAGHVTPNIALLPRLRELGYEISYMGSYDGIEKKLIEEFEIPYYGISSGKLRRYFDPKNFTVPFKVLAARHFKIPAIIHESDMTPGLANKLCIPSAWKVCCNFPETLQYLPKEKAVLTGSPIRQELLKGDALKALRFTGLSPDKPVILVMGGSLGAAAVNEAVRSVLPRLLKDYHVIHLCGKGKLDPSLSGLSGYVQYEYIKSELKDLFALCEIVISRAGANAICELLALRKPSLLIPLPAASSRGDQLLNARSFEKQGFSMVLEEEQITPDSLLSAVHTLYENRQKMSDAMAASRQTDSIETIISLIEEAAGRNS